MENERKNPVRLERLAFAPTDHPWDEAEALKRIQQHLGWGALSEYSLLVDFSGDPQAHSTYSLLVADIVNDQPVIVPAALQAARQKVAGLEGTDAEKAEAALEYLENLLAHRQDNHPIQDTPAEDGRQLSASDQQQSSPELSIENPDQKEPTVAGEGIARSIVNRLASEGKVVPSMGFDSLVAFIAGLTTEKTIGVEGSEMLSPVEFFTGLMETLPSLVPTIELAAAFGRKTRSFEQAGHRIAQAVK